MTSLEPPHQPLPPTDPRPAVDPPRVTGRILLVMRSADLRDRLLPPPLLERLAALGDLDPQLVVDDFDRVSDEVLAEVEVIFGGWGVPPLEPEVLARLPRLRLVAYAAGTVKGFLRPGVLSAGIRVTTAAAANAVPVGEFAYAMIILANKQLLHAIDAYRRRRQAVPFLDDSGNVDRTVGIIGASLVGREVLARLAGHPLRLLLADPTITAAEARRLGAELVDLDTLMATADVISLHAPVLPATIGMIGAPQVSAMRDGATFINTARGVLVDHAALRAELALGRISAILDVTDPEPLPPDDPLRTMPNVLLTPHLAGAQGHELRLLAGAALDEIARYAAGRPAAHPVTAAALATMA